MKDRFIVRTAYYSAPIETPISICYLSDLHFNGRSGKMVAELIAYLRAHPPDLILLGGDYLDTRRGEPHFAALLTACAACCQTYAISGNHDRFYGIDRIRVLCTCHEVTWLEGETMTIRTPSTDIHLHGGFVPSTSPPAGALSIVVLHEPFGPERLEGHCHLAFAGHLHGCQFVFWRRGFDFYPGNIFFCKNNFTEWRDGTLA